MLVNTDPTPEDARRLKHITEVPAGSALALKRTPLAPRYHTYRDFQVGDPVSLCTHTPAIPTTA